MMLWVDCLFLISRNAAFSCLSFFWSSCLLLCLLRGRRSFWMLNRCWRSKGNILNNDKDTALTKRRGSVMNHSPYETFTRTLKPMCYSLRSPWYKQCIHSHKIVQASIAQNCLKLSWKKYCEWHFLWNSEAHSKIASYPFLENTSPSRRLILVQLFHPISPRAKPFFFFFFFLSFPLLFFYSMHCKSFLSNKSIWISALCWGGGWPKRRRTIVGCK